jgi:colanic acid biosynthesis protein WcaH
MDVIKNTNLFAFDLIIKDHENKFLLAKRDNLPAKGFLFVPGGRVYKNENLNDAFSRVLLEELGLKMNDFSYVKYKGLYNHIYEDNFYENPSFNTHYIIYAVELKLKDVITINLDEQHSEYAFMSIRDILSNHSVHLYTKNYFIDRPGNLFREFNL